MKWFRKSLKNPSDRNLPALRNVDLAESLIVPEPTQSLLWVTDEDTSRISSPFSIHVTISLGPAGVSSETDDGKNFFGEPSLIWTKLPVKKNAWLEKEPLYYPSYSSFTPEHRYQYLKWLTDITQSTNLSYVFLYFYGLERHLLVGNFDAATTEILRLLDHHAQTSFRAYAEQSLIAAALYKQQLELFERRPDLLDELSNEALLVKRHLGQRLQPQELMRLASRVGVKNQRYIKLHPDLFASELEKLLIKLEFERGPILEISPIKSLRVEKQNIFANLSLPDTVREVNAPQLLYDPQFQDACRNLLEEAHINLKKKHGGKINARYNP